MNGRVGSRAIVCDLLYFTDVTTWRSAKYCVRRPGTNYVRNKLVVCPPRGMCDISAIHHSNILEWTA
jgi:hypothetical protein